MLLCSENVNAVVYHFLNTVKSRHFSALSLKDHIKSIFLAYCYFACRILHRIYGINVDVVLSLTVVWFILPPIAFAPPSIPIGFASKYDSLFLKKPTREAHVVLYTTSSLIAEENITFTIYSRRTRSGLPKTLSQLESGKCRNWLRWIAFGVTSSRGTRSFAAQTFVHQWVA